MSRTGRTILFMLGFVFLGFGIWGWWALFHNKTSDAVLIVDWRRNQLEEIRHIAQANPHLCRFWAEENNATVGKLRSTRDLEDRRTVSKLTSEALANSVEIECDSSKDWALVDLRVWIFDEGLLPNTPPIYAFWRTPSQTSAEGDLGKCKQVSESNWYVCPGKWVFL